MLNEESHFTAGFIVSYVPALQIPRGSATACFRESEISSAPRLCEIPIPQADSRSGPEFVAAVRPARREGMSSERCADDRGEFG
jgi:hypothetical protein